MKILTRKQKQIQWRRDKVDGYMVKGFSQSEIAENLQISNATVTRDVDYLREEARKQLKTHLEDRIPIGYNQCISGIDEILKNAWDIAIKKGDEKTRLQALTLANECYKHKMDLITNGVVIVDALKFVKEHKNNNNNSNIKINDDEINTEFETTKDAVF
jgi:DNA-binding transcriptional regulator LsrR (DeoR family)